MRDRQWFQTPALFLLCFRNDIKTTCQTQGASWRKMHKTHHDKTKDFGIGISREFGYRPIAAMQPDGSGTAWQTGRLVWWYYH